MDFTAFFKALTDFLPFMPKIYNEVIIAPADLVMVFFWFLAAVVSFYFSLGNARLWTSISIGFFLIFWSQGYLLNPYASSYFRVTAVHSIIGAVSIMLITHGFQEYFVFTRTLELTGSKRTIYITTAVAILIGIFVVYLNPKPSLFTLRNYKMMENSVWAFLSLVNIYVIVNIWREMRDSPIANGILAFAVVFFFILMWKSSELYLQLYQFDATWQMLVEEYDLSIKTYGLDDTLVKIATKLNSMGALFSGISVGGTFVYLYKLLR